MLSTLSAGLARKAFNMKHNTLKVGATVRHLDDGALGQVVRVDHKKQNGHCFFVSWADNPDWHSAKQLTLVN